MSRFCNWGMAIYKSTTKQMRIAGDFSLPSDSSMMTYFRKTLSPEILMVVNEGIVIELGADEDEDPQAD